MLCMSYHNEKIHQYNNKQAKSQAKATLCLLHFGFRFSRNSGGDSIIQAEHLFRAQVSHYQLCALGQISQLPEALSSCRCGGGIVHIPKACGEGQRSEYKMTLTCNPNYSGSGDQEGPGSKPAQANSS
jgi:hypothetical protein